MLTKKQHRLKHYNYNSNGAYFITICTKDKKCILGKVVDGLMVLNEYGIIAKEEIKKTNKLRNKKGIFINHFVIMPNHIHLIIEVKSCRDTACCVRKNQHNQFGQMLSQSIPAVVRSYKSAVCKQINIASGGHSALCPYSHDNKSIWQASYHDHVVRNQKNYDELLKYIDENPIRWHLDCYHNINGK